MVQKSNAMKVVSLFSGAGGFDLGLIQAGHSIIWANDIDQDAVQTYRKNIGAHIIQGDIADIASSDIPESDVVIGGFPCQGFSQANLLRSALDVRNKLYVHFVRVVKDKQPKYFLAENVRGLLSVGKGKVIECIMNDFRDAGYRVQYRLFNMADYGVPQMRFRVIISGISKELPGECTFPYPAPTHGKVTTLLGLSPWITIAEALKGIPEPEDDPTLPNHISSKYKVTNRNFTGHRWTDPNKPSPTILARGDGKGGVCAIQHPNNHRRLSVRESATIQTFPMDFIFVGKMNSCYRQVGNAVPVHFAWHLGNQLKALEGDC
jgi:DNA (cytosine-5)-methyltransferase 1